MLAYQVLQQVWSTWKASLSGIPSLQVADVSALLQEASITWPGDQDIANKQQELADFISKKCGEDRRAALLNNFALLGDLCGRFGQV